ncbi:hypothetical protein FRB94_003186 [Tulasnella sp. JGI-2019a]|nr:hypothetical protein FRB94_003186 [Tulasnella sp. JGI-2019a]
MSGRKIGTVVVVILKAKNLPNKRHIGKQDPYCVLKLNGETRRTNAVKRGGQHPEWDEELRFPVYESVEDELARTAGNGDVPPPPPPKDGAAPTPKKKAKQIMNLHCYADDPREPDLIGDTTVDLTEALTKGEIDEWFSLMFKNKYAGEVYLEITYWSEEEPPPKPAPQQSALNPQYGGRGSFVPAGEIPASLKASSSGYSPAQPPPRRVSSGNAAPTAQSSYNGRQSNGGQTSPIRNSSRPSLDARQAIPDSLRPSSSLATLDLYIPSYSSSNGGRPASAHPDERHGSTYGRNSYGGGSKAGRVDEYDEFGVPGAYPAHRESLPPTQHPSALNPRQSSYETVVSPTSTYQDPYAAGGSLSGAFSSMSISGPPPSQSYGSSMALSTSYGGGSALFPLPGPSGFAPPPQPAPTPTPVPQYAPQHQQYGGPPPFQQQQQQQQQPYLPPSSSTGFHPPPANSGFYPPNTSATPVPYYPSTTPTPYQQHPGGQYSGYNSATPAPPPPQQQYQNYGGATPAPMQPQQQAYPTYGTSTPAPLPPQQQQPAYQQQSYQPVQSQQQWNQAPPPLVENGYYQQHPPPPSATPLPPPPPPQSAPPVQPQYQQTQQHQQQQYANYPPPPPQSTSAPPTATPQNQPWLSSAGSESHLVSSPPHGSTPLQYGSLPGPPPPPPPPLYANGPNQNKPLPTPGQQHSPLNSSASHPLLVPSQSGGLISLLC